jgi:hypothetical protein
MVSGDRIPHHDLIPRMPRYNDTYMDTDRGIPRYVNLLKCGYGDMIVYII